MTTLIPELESCEVKWSRYRPGVTQRVGRGIALLFHDRGTRRWWVVSSTPRPHFTPVIDPVPILQEAGWAPGPVWTGGKISSPGKTRYPSYRRLGEPQGRSGRAKKSRSYRDSISDRPACSSVAIPTELQSPQSESCSHIISFSFWHNM